MWQLMGGWGVGWSMGLSCVAACVKHEDVFVKKRWRGAAEAISLGLSMVWLVGLLTHESGVQIPTRPSAPCNIHLFCIFFNM